MHGSPQNVERPSAAFIARSWLGSLLCLLTIAALEQSAVQGQQVPLLIGSFGASAVLSFGAIYSPLAQPRNLVLGHFLSALVGVSCRLLLPDALWLAAPLAVASAIVLMQISRSLHPPGGATALIAVIGGESVWRLGYWYAFVPCLAGALIMLLFALVMNNIPKEQHWPLWWDTKI